MTKRANLLAAAPDLYKALQQLVKAIMDDAGGADLLPVHYENDPEHFALIQAARAALVKAEG